MSSGGRYDFTGTHAAVHDRTLWRSFTWSNDDGTPVVLTGYTARMQVRASADAAAVLLEASAEDDTLLITEPSAGVVVLDILVDCAPGRYVYEIALFSGAVAVPLLSGTFEVLREVVR